MTIDELIAESHETALSKGWWDHDRTFGECIALAHSELSEALEEFRQAPLDLDTIWFERGGPDNRYIDQKYDTDKPVGIASELADTMIRLADMAGRWNIPLAEAIRVKLDHNKTRPHRHGGKAL